MQKPTRKTLLVLLLIYGAASLIHFIHSVTPTFGGVNHEPTVEIEGPLDVSVKAGESIRLSGSISDPNGDDVTVRWWQYAEAGSYPGRVTLADTTALSTSFQVPPDATPGNTIHLILEATDNGMPALTRSRRVILSVTP